MVLTDKHKHALTHALTLARTHSHTLSLTHALTLTSTHSHTHALTHARTHASVRHELLLLREGTPPLSAAKKFPYVLFKQTMPLNILMRSQAQCSSVGGTHQHWKKITGTDMIGADLKAFHGFVVGCLCLVEVKHVAEKTKTMAFVIS